MYIYPDNLKAKATMWLWKLKDLAIIGIIVLLSVFAFAYSGLWFPLVIAGAYAFLTIQVRIPALWILSAMPVRTF